MHTFTCPFILRQSIPLLAFALERARDIMTYVLTAMRSLDAFIDIWNLSFNQLKI